VVLAAAEAPAWLLLAVPALTAFLGFLIGQLVPEFFNRREIGRARYDAALTAATNAYAARHGVGLSIPKEWLKSPDDATHAATESELSKAAIVRFLDTSAEARSALAALYPWSPDLRIYWDRPFMEGDDFAKVVSILAERRKSPLKRYGARADS
jgi:hypothetical protein